MASPENSASFIVLRPVLVGGQPEPASAFPLSVHGIALTGEHTAVFSRSREVLKPTKSERRTRLQTMSPEVRLAFRTFWKTARQAAIDLQTAAQDDEVMDRVRAADSLETTLSRLWDLHEYRDVNWQSVLNLVQGMLKQFFAAKQVELLTTEQCRHIYDIVDRYLGPSTKTADDLNEVVRLIADAGADPFAAISGEPTEE
jgi:hypothetical protein